MQKGIWEREYREHKHLPSTRTMQPSKAGDGDRQFLLGVMGKG